MLLQARHFITLLRHRKTVPTQSWLASQSSRTFSFQCLEQSSFFKCIKNKKSTINASFLVRPCRGVSFQKLEQSKVVRDVILFKYENLKFYRYLNIFAVLQFVFWSFMGKFSVSSMRHVPVEKNVSQELPWWRKVNLGEGKYKNTLAGLCYVFGAGLLACSWVFTLRSVRFLVLHKGGHNVSLVTYTPFGENRILTVPLDKVSCKLSRASAKSTLPIKVKNQRFHYLLDMRGEFKNPQLFDITAGLQRKL